MKSILELALPKDIAIGPFCVNVRPLRDFLIQKRQSCCTQLLIMFTESLRTKIDVVLSDYVQIKTRLRTTPRNIEHLFEEQDWIETVPLRVKKLDEIVQKLKFQYDILDHFWWNLSDEDFDTKWQAIGFPRQVQLYVRFILCKDILIYRVSMTITTLSIFISIKFRRKSVQPNCGIKRTII